MRITSLSFRSAASSWCGATGPRAGPGTQLSDHGVAHEALAAAAATPLAGFEDPAREHGTAGFEALAGHLKSGLAETAERGQIGAREPSSRARRDGSAGHAEVFQMSV
jgi:hypothetical protein